MSRQTKIEDFAKWFTYTEQKLKLTMLHILVKATEENAKEDEVVDVVIYAILDFALKSHIISGVEIEGLRAVCDKIIDQLTTKDPDVLNYFKATEKAKQ
jgi:hypothetical protein